MLHHTDMRILTIVFASVLASGCYATASTGYGGTVTATTVAPDLVYVSPGVQVIADYDEPVFYADGFYWRETGGVWYRSSYHTHGWSYYAPPRSLVTIRDRGAYRRYRPAGYTPRNRAYQPRDNRAYQPRDRAYQPRDNRAYQPRDNNRGAYQPVQRRDNRAYQPRDNNRGAYQPAERRDNRKDRRNDRRDDRKDNRKDRRR
jgi:hypothetical protein